MELDKVVKIMIKNVKLHDFKIMLPMSNLKPMQDCAKEELLSKIVETMESLCVFLSAMNFRHRQL